MEKCAVFDIDNTLFDARERYRVAIRKFNVLSPRELPFELQKDFWKDFMSPELFHLDKPISRSIEMIIGAKKRGLRIVLVTGRYEWLRRETILQLMLAGAPSDELLMRPSDNYQEDRELKPFLIKDLKCEVVEYHDDDLGALLEMRKMFPNALLFLHKPDGTFNILPYGDMPKRSHLL